MLFYSPTHDAALLGALQSLRKALLNLRLREGMMKNEEEETLGGGRGHLHLPHLGHVPLSRASEKPDLASPLPYLLLGEAPEANCPGSWLCTPSTWGSPV